MGPLPQFGEKEGQLPYTHWLVEAQAVLTAAELLCVVREDRPSDHDPELLAWFDRANNKVYAALLQAVRPVPVLGDKCRLVGGFPGCARLAWETIRDHYIRLSEDTSFLLMRKLNGLRPLKGENMEAFLLRCDQLREEFARFGQTLDDAPLIEQVFTGLERMWRVSLGHSIESLAKMSWGTIKLL